MEHNICLINDSFPPVIDGVANAVLNYANCIENELGHVVVATPHDPRAKDDNYPFPVVRFPSVDMIASTGYCAGVPFSPHLVGKLREEKTELIHVHCPIASTFMARQIREQIHAPIVLTYHTKYDIDIANVIHSKFLQEGSIRALVENVNACDAVWVVSKGAGENLRSIGYEGEYLVMPNGVDLPKGCVDEETMHRATESYDLPDGVPVYLFVGRLMWYKGLRIILDALAQLKEKGQAFRMVFLGAGGDAEEVRAYAEELGLGELCIFAGAVTDREAIRAWYTRADLFLFPSTFDTNGLVVREAAACSLASVLIAGSCAAEGVTDGRNAFLIEENADSLAAKLLEIGSNFTLLRQAGACAADELYISWQQAVQHAWAEYEVVLENYRSGRYTHHESAMDEFLNIPGELMSVISEAQQERESMSARLHMDLRRFQDRREEHAAEIRERRQEIKHEIREKRQELWEKMDRYL